MADEYEYDEDTADHGGATEHDRSGSHRVPIPSATSGRATGGIATGTDAATASADAAMRPFEAETSNARIVVSLLTGISNGRKDEQAQVTVNANGLRVSIENRDKTLHGTAYLKRQLFERFAFHLDVDFKFRVNLSTVIDCLSVFGAASLTSTSLHMTFDPTAMCFKLTLQEGGVITDCDIRTSECIEELDFRAAFISTATINTVTVKAEPFKEALTELTELPSAHTISLLMTPVAPFFRLSADGSTGSCQVEIPKTSDVFTSFQSNAPQCFHYNLPLIHSATRVLPNADTAKIRINESGMLSLDHQLMSDSGTSCYVCFVLLPNEAVLRLDDGSTAGSQASVQIDESM